MSILYHPETHDTYNRAVRRLFVITEEMRASPHNHDNRDTLERLFDDLMAGPKEVRELFIDQIDTFGPRRCPYCRFPKMFASSRQKDGICKACKNDTYLRGVSPGWRRDMLDQQEGKCGLCHKQQIDNQALYSTVSGPKTEGPGGEIDHDPKFNDEEWCARYGFFKPIRRGGQTYRTDWRAVRGLICMGCNRRLSGVSLADLRVRADRGHADWWDRLALAYLEAYEEKLLAHITDAQREQQTR